MLKFVSRCFNQLAPDWHLRIARRCSRVNNSAVNADDGLDPKTQKGQTEQSEFSVLLSVILVACFDKHVGESLLTPLLDAIDHGNSDDFDRELTLPEGTLINGKRIVTIREILIDIGLWDLLDR